MRRRLSLVGLIVLLLWGGVGPVAPGLGSPASAAEPTAGRLARVDAYVREQMERTRAPGSALAVVSGDEVTHRRTWGKDGNGSPITPRTPFLVGSVAKPVTAMAVMRLVERGRIRLDDRVREYLPWFRPSGAGGERLTIRHLLNQSSGISEREGLEQSDRGDNDPGGVQRRARSLAGVRLSGVPGERHRYSAANFMLLGAVVEKVTGRPFGDHLTADILRPLGMTGAITDAAAADRRGLAPGHRYYFGRPRRHGPAFDTSGVPYGYLGASLDDMGRFAAVQLGARQGVLSQQTIRRMHRGTVPVRGSQRYGLGWRDDSLDGLGVRAVWHGGATPGYQAVVVLAPDKRLGVVVQQNVYGIHHDELLLSAGFGALRILLGAEPEPGAVAPWYGRTLAALVAVAALFVVAVVWSLVRLVRPRRGRARSGGRVLVGGVLGVTGGGSCGGRGGVFPGAGADGGGPAAGPALRPRCGAVADRGGRARVSARGAARRGHRAGAEGRGGRWRWRGRPGRPRDGPRSDPEPTLSRPRCLPDASRRCVKNL